MKKTEEFPSALEARSLTARNAAAKRDKLILTVRARIKKNVRSNVAEGYDCMEIRPLKYLMADRDVIALALAPLLAKGYWSTRLYEFDAMQGLDVNPVLHWGPKPTFSPKSPKLSLWVRFQAWVCKLLGD